MFVALAIFGTTVFFLRYIAMPLATVAFACCLFGMVAVLVAMKLTRRKLRWRYIKESVPLSLLSGVALGGSWILLICAQKSTDSSITTVYYYLMPMVLALLTPLLGEKSRKKKLFLCALCLGGLVLTTGFWEKGFVWDISFLCALFAGVLHGAMVVCNKKLLDISSYDKTLLQLAATAAVLLPYCLFTDGFTGVKDVSATGLAALIVLGVVHTGLACRMYFDSLVRLPLQSVAIYSYINPAVTIFVTTFMTKQKLQLEEVLGVTLILGGIMVGELSKENFGRLFEKKG